MKRTALFLLAILLVLPAAMQAQRNALYYSPKKTKKAATPAVAAPSRSAGTLQSEARHFTLEPVEADASAGSERDVDEYNRRYSGSAEADSAPVQDDAAAADDGWVGGFDGSDEDYECAMRIVKFRSPRVAIPVSSPLYWDVVYGNLLWPAYDWNIYDDGLYAYVFPTYTNRLYYSSLWDWGWGWHTPGFYTSWGWGWHTPGFYSSWSWGWGGCSWGWGGGFGWGYPHRPHPHMGWGGAPGWNSHLAGRPVYPSRRGESSSRYSRPGSTVAGRGTAAASNRTWRLQDRDDNRRTNAAGSRNYNRSSSTRQQSGTQQRQQSATQQRQQSGTQQRQQAATQQRQQSATQQRQQSGTRQSSSSSSSRSSSSSSSRSDYGSSSRSSSSSSFGGGGSSSRSSSSSFGGGGGSSRGGGGGGGSRGGGGRR